jgi:hypothetical protein
MIINNVTFQPDTYALVPYFHQFQSNKKLCWETINEKKNKIIRKISATIKVTSCYISEPCLYCSMITFE